MTGEMSLALYGAWRLARLDRGGLAYFDRSLAGVWRSFRAAAIIYPGFLVLLALSVPDEQWTRAGAGRVVVVETIAYVIGWVGYPLLLLPITRFLGREHRVLDFIVAYNWAQILEMVLLVTISVFALSGIFPGPASVALLYAGRIAILGYEWFIARVALDVTGGPATLVVLVNFVFIATIDKVADHLLSGGAAGLP
jgi:hypothetical protein